MSLRELHGSTKNHSRLRRLRLNAVAGNSVNIQVENAFIIRYLIQNDNIIPSFPFFAFSAFHSAIMVASIIVILFLLALSAFFSASETAFSSASKTRLKALAENGSRLAAIALKLFNDYDRLISTILVGNNIVNIVLTAVCTMLFVNLYGDGWGVTLSMVVTTVAVLVFGELTPKSVVHEHPEEFAQAASWLLLFFKWLLFPVNAIFALWKRLLSRMMHIEETPKMSQEELLMLVDEVQSDGSIDQDEGALLRNAIKFTECKVEEIITHRVDIAALPLDASREDVAAMFMETQFSRLPVYLDNLDNIVGVLVLKDFYASQNSPEWNLKDIITPPFFVQKTEKIDDVLKKLQNSHSQIAVVLDEFGGTLGIVSMEDILEELVGEIWDEHDEAVEKFKDLGNGVTSVDCTVSLDDFQDYFNVKVQSEESLLNGFICEQFHKIPQKGDRCRIGPLDIVVSSCSRHRVRRVDVTVVPQDTENE